MRNYLLQHSTTAVKDERMLAINNPVGSGITVEIRCVENSLIETGAASDFRIDRFPAIATGGTAALFEPGDDDADLPRVCRRDSSSPEPIFVVLGGSFTAPTGREFDESFSIRSRETERGCRDLSENPIVINAGECAVLTLLESEASQGARVSVELVEIDDEPLMHLGTGGATRLEGELFDGSGALSATRWTVTPTGTGTALQSGGELVIATGATANSAELVESVRHVRFMSDETHEFEAWVRIADAGSVNNVRRWGPMTAVDGFYFELSGTTLRVGSRKASVNTSVAASLWHRRGHVLDANYHHYMVRFNGNTAEFRIDHVLVHRLYRRPTPITTTLDLPLRFENINSGGLASDLAMRVRDVVTKRYAPQAGAGHFLHMAAGAATATVKASAGTLKSLHINGPGMGGSTVTLYDNTAASGTVIAVLNSDASGAFPYEIEFSTGLTVAKTLTSPDVTVVFD